MEKCAKDEESLKLALNKYKKREVSLGMAAKIAKVPIADFMVMVAKRKIPINYTVEWLKEDFKAAIRDAKSTSKTFKKPILHII